MAGQRVLVTGAAGGVATMLIPGLVDNYELRLADRVPITGPYSELDTVQGDTVDREHLTTIVAGVDSIVYLAGNPYAGSTWSGLIGPNVDSVVGVLDAAHAAGVRQVILASSVHAMGQYEVTDQIPIDETWATSPCCLYGSTKAFNEAVGRAYSHQTGMSVVCLRYGYTTPRPSTQGSLTCWLGAEDLQQLVSRVIESDVRFGVYHGVSANTRGRWSIARGQADLGYHPVLDAEKYADGPLSAVTRDLCVPGKMPFPSDV